MLFQLFLHARELNAPKITQNNLSLYELQNTTKRGFIIGILQQAMLVPLWTHVLSAYILKYIYIMNVYTHDLRSGSQDHHPSTNWVQKTICCKLTSSAPDDGRMRPKLVELRKLQWSTLLHQVGISLYFMMKMHGQTTLKKCIHTLIFLQPKYNSFVFSFRSPVDRNFCTIVNIVLLH